MTALVNLKPFEVLVIKPFNKNYSSWRFVKTTPSETLLEIQLLINQYRYQGIVYFWTEDNCLDIFEVLKLLNDSQIETPVMAVFPTNMDEWFIGRAIRSGLHHFVIGQQSHKIEQHLLVMLENANKITNPSAGHPINKYGNILRAFLEEATDCIYLKNPEGKYILINKAGTEFLGKTREEVIGYDDYDLFSPEAAKKIQSTDRQVYLTGETTTFEAPLLTLSGELKTYLAMKAAYRDERGIIQGVMGIVRNITDLKQVEEALKISENKYKALYDCEKKIQLTIAALSKEFNPYNDVVNQIRLSLQATQVTLLYGDSNMLMPNIYVCPTNKTLITQDIGAFFNVFAEEHHCLCYVSDINTTTVIPHVAQYLIDTFSEVPIQSFVYAPVSFDDTLLGLVLVTNNNCHEWSPNERNYIETVIGHLKIHWYQVRIRQELEKALLLKSKLLSNMTHEIRTPLNAILAYTEIMQLNPNKNYSQQITDAGHHLLTLVNDILDMAKIESGNMKVKLEYVDIPHLIAKTVDLLAGLVANKKLRLDVNIQPDWPTTLTDKNKLIQILTNLLSNAIKFTPVEGYIKLKAEYNLADKKLTFMVLDNGIGIDSADYDNVFTEFNQIESSHQLNQQTGSGLGLALSRKLARLLQGDLTVNSKLGQGSNFILKLHHYAD